MNTVLLVIIVMAVAVLLLLKPSSGSGQFSYRLKPYPTRSAKRVCFFESWVLNARYREYWERVHDQDLFPGWEMGDLTLVSAKCTHQRHQCSLN